METLARTRRDAERTDWQLRVIGALPRPQRVEFGVGRLRSLRHALSVYGRSALIALVSLLSGCVSAPTAADPQGANEARLNPGHGADSVPGARVASTRVVDRITARPRPVSPQRFGERTPSSDRVGFEKVSLAFTDTSLTQVLEEVAAVLRLELIVDRSVTDAVQVSVRFDELTLTTLLRALEEMFPIRIDRERRLLRVTGLAEAPLALLVYPLPSGLVAAELEGAFDSLEQLSFVSRTQRDGESADASAAPPPDTAPDAPSAHLERFLGQLPMLVPWSEGSSWFLDRRSNLLFVRGTSEALDQIERCLDLVAKPPVLVQIEARFVELSEGFGRELGVELGLLDPFPLDRTEGNDLFVLGTDSGTRVGVPPLSTTVSSGLNLSVLGVISQPRLQAVLRALEETSAGEIISAPTVSSVNNSRATIAITTNLPYVEGFEPVFDTTVVATDGISTSDANVALVARINDSNFTGIVLNVTPSVGSDRERIQLRIQPVIRDQVGAISIAQGALFEGGADPNITRPIIETRYLDAQLGVRDGETIVLGGWKTESEREEVVGVPLLQSVPLLGRLFQRSVVRREVRDLVVFVTARVMGGGGLRVED